MQAVAPDVTHPTTMRGILASVLLLCAHAVTAGQALTAELSIGTDDNLLSNRDGTPQLTEQFLQTGLGLSAATALAPGLSARGLARLDSRLHARYEGLNDLGASAEGQLLYRPGTGFSTPTLGLSLGVGVQEFESRLRDARESRLKLFARQNLTTRVVARGGLFASWRGTQSRAFDATQRGAELALDWQAAPRLNAGLGYQYRRGEVTSVGTAGGAARANAVALEPDDVFAGRMAFSFPAQTHIGTLSLNYALSARLALDGQLRYVESDTDFDTRYSRWIALTGLLYRF